MLNCFTDKKEHAKPIIVIQKSQFKTWLGTQSDITKTWFASLNFQSETENLCLIPNAKGELAFVLCCVNNPNNLWEVGAFALSLPAGKYYFEDEAYLFGAVAWGLSAYQFKRYKKPTRTPAILFVPAKELKSISNIVESIYLVRDLINTPTDDMGPTELAEATHALAKKHHAQFHQIVGEDLLHENYAGIYTVGRASDESPRLLDLRWGDPKHPKVSLVGKGVCFDTGGLDIKSAPYMLLMKKDMGGAAHVLGLANMIMTAKLPVCLRVLIPAVENAVSGNAYRPGDVIKSRKGLTIEVGNTDAEGRVVLADALCEASSESPDLLIDISTLTGAARVAVGTEIAAVFSNNDEIIRAIIETGDKLIDPIWRLPLFAPYKEYLNSPIADLNNCPSDSYGGAITAALFMQAFVPSDVSWVHFDIMAWNLRSKPGRPQGGEAMGLRALFDYLTERYG